MGSIMNFPIRRIPHFHESEYQSPQWFEELIEPDLKWSFEINSVLHAGTSEYQNIVLLDTNRFGKALVIDGKMQSAGKDEFIYHECLVHPVLIFCESPKSVFIMGGGEGSTAREVLKHNGVEKVVVVDFCRMHLTANQEAFSDGRLHYLADPLDGGPCNHLYTKSFYEQVIKTKLNDSGIFVTQAGPAGVLSHKEVFSPIYNTIKQIAYTAHVPSNADSCGWVLASDQQLKLDVEKIEEKIRERVMRDLLMNETHVLSQGNASYLHGHGVADSA
ncbi:hypothetical protein P3X46_019600 [Hevea brasiliensis]|uniref:thermospermine synthase n=1 Tax=Hevea brasiliensis TaxID=3981 RepID=A0ABQ9LN54_HEVBR|nr:hypothetical protein P3X46_019600 [Hevea brasiliensis]